MSGLNLSVVTITVWFWTEPQQTTSLLTRHQVMVGVKKRLDAAGIEMPAGIVALQATSSYAAALRGDDVTPGGAVER